MENKEFDDWLSRKFEEEDLEYQPNQWRKLSQNLQENKNEEKKSKLWALSLGLTAALALVFASILLVRLVNSEPASNKKGFAFTTPYEIPYQPLAESATETESKDAANKIPPPTIKKQQSSKVLAENSKKNEIAKRKPSSIALKNELNVSPQEKLEEKETIQELSMVRPGKSEILKKEQFDPQKHAISPTASFSFKGNSYPDEFTEQASSLTSKNEEKTSFAIGGGVNYSSLNTGYTLNVSAKQRLGQKFFVDGTIAVLYNNNTENTGNFAGNTASRSANHLITMASPAFTPWQNLYYMQVNPSFGYQLSKEIGLSIGGDVQQMISQDNHVNKIQFTNDGIKLFPVVDFGVTGKAEFDVTPNIKTGLMFREGLNNTFQSQTAPFVNRRYFQIQFKYNIPIK